MPKPAPVKALGANRVFLHEKDDYPIPTYDFTIMSYEFHTTLHDLQDRFEQERRSTRKAILLTASALLGGTVVVILVKLFV